MVKRIFGESSPLPVHNIFPLVPSNLYQITVHPLWCSNVPHQRNLVPYTSLVLYTEPSNNALLATCDWWIEPAPSLGAYPGL